MASALLEALKRNAGEEKMATPPYALIESQLVAQSQSGADEKSEEAPDAADGIRLDLSGSRKELFSSRVTDEVLDTLCLACVEVSPTFSVLDLSCNRLTDACTLPELIKAANVEHLILRSNDIGAEGTMNICNSIVEGFGQGKILRTLVLNGNPIGEDGGLAVAQMLQEGSAVEHLDLGNAEIGTQSLIALASALGYNHSLKVVNLENPRTYEIEDTTTYHIAKMLRANRSLEELYLGKHNMTDSGAQLLAEHLEDNASLRVLDLRANKIGIAGAESLAILLMRGGTIIQVLNLASNRICDQGAQALAVALRSSGNLQSLDVSRNEIGDMGLVAIADALNSNSTLERLRLFGNEFGEQAADAIKELFESRFKYFDFKEKDFVPYVVDGRPMIAKCQS
eukprot:g2015.t1